MFSFIIGVFFAYQWTGPWDLVKVIWLIFIPQRRLLIGLMLGALAVYLAASYHQRKQLSSELWQVPQEIQIKVLSFQPISSYLYHYHVWSDDLNQAFNLSHYERQQWFQPGHCYIVKAKLRPVRALGNATTAGSDKQAWVKREFVRGHIVGANQGVYPRSFALINSEIPCHKNTWSLNHLRYQIDHYIQRLDLSPTSTALIKALVIGEKGNLNPSHWETFEKTGTSHLMAISGLHIGLVYLFCLTILKILLRPLSLILLRSNMMMWARVGALFCAGLYVLISGMGLSSQRAWGMLALLVILALNRKELPALQILLLVVVAILVVDPLAGMGLGLWLSAGAVFALIWLRDSGWQLQWKLTVLMLPLTSVMVNTSLISPLVNALAIPFVSFLVVPGALMGVVMHVVGIPGADLLMKSVAWLIDNFWIGLSWASQYTWMIHWSLLTWVDWVVFISLICCLLLPWRLIGPIPFVILSASLTWAKPIQPEPGIVFLRVMDAGQGTALLVQVGDKNLLFDVGNTIVANDLRHHRIQNLDVLVVSHRDKDHRAGLVELLEKIRVEKFYAGESLSESTSTIPCRAGESWDWEEVHFEFLAPLHEGLKGNNASCVLKISLGEQSILFTGDIERKVERELVNLQAEKLKSTILIAPHHGSKTSSSLDFIQAVSPQIVIYPTGFLNAYHHPHPTIVNRYSEFGIKQYNTAQVGALSVKLSKQGVESLRCYRQDHPHWWNMDTEVLC